jgi:hypothetical protein
MALDMVIPVTDEAKQYLEEDVNPIPEQQVEESMMNQTASLLDESYEK